MYDFLSISPRFSAWLMVLSLFIKLSQAEAAPLVSNNSFEAHPSPIWPGISPILGWTIETGKSIGVAPCVIAPMVTDPDDTFGVNVFCNNGRIPNGTNVAFIWGSGKLTQTITNLEGGKSYAVTFYYNSRAIFPSATLYTSLGGSMVIAGVDVPAVAEKGNHDAPYYRAMSAPFTPAATGNYDLVIENNTVVDSTLVFDQVEILELGDLKILSAKRDIENPYRVVVEFSKSPNPTLATDAANYILDNGGRVESVQMGADTKSVVLATTYLSRLSLPALKLIWITDNSGKGMLPENAEAQITVDPLPGVTLNIKVQGSEVIVSWPTGTSSTGLSLYKINAFDGVSFWENLGEILEEEAGQFVYKQPVENAPLFFRLMGQGAP